MHSSLTILLVGVMSTILVTAGAAPPPAADPSVEWIPVHPKCNQPNNRIPALEGMPELPAPPHRVKLQENCCYDPAWALGNNVCLCKAWSDWCKGRFSDCCGEAKACTQYCTCIPNDRICANPGNKFEKKCDHPYEGQGDTSWARELPDDQGPECPT